MKRVFSPILCVLFVVLISACNSRKQQAAKPGEGMVVYKVSYPDSAKYGMKSAFFPREIVLVFKNDKAAFIASGAMGMIQLVNLLDAGKKNYVSLLIDRLRQNIGCKLTPDEITQNEQSDSLLIRNTNEQKVIAGMNCQKAIVTDVGSGLQTEVFFNDTIQFSYRNSPFKNIPFLMLEYTHAVNNLAMKLEATKVDFSSPVDTSLFTVKGEYQWVTQKEFYQYLSSL